MAKTTILIIGATGLLGNALFTELSNITGFNVFGTTRMKEGEQYLPAKTLTRIIPFVDIENWNSIIDVFVRVKPDVVVNCVGLIKQVMSKDDTARAILTNSLWPHQLSALCQASHARLIHFSTDCVYSGAQGKYREADPSDAEDIYGKTKYLGEMPDATNCVTVRTSFIGHGLENHLELVDWFLGQKVSIKGFTKVIYSGLPTTEQARLIAQYIIPNKRLKGLYHVSAEPISKYDLLKIIAKVYGKKIEIRPFDDIANDRSLNSARFRKITGYVPPSWPQLVREMYQYYKKNKNFIKF